MADKQKGKVQLTWIIVIIEAILIVLLTFQKISETKEKLNLTLQLKTGTQELSEKEAQVKELQGQVAELEKTRTSQETQINELTIKQKAIESKMEGTKEATETLTREVKLQQEATLKELKNISAENRKIQLALISKIKSLIEAKRDLELRLAQAKSAAQQQQQAAGPENQNSQEVPLGKINVQKKPAETAAPPKTAAIPKEALEGIVLSVDNRYNFVIISLGKEKNIKPKDRFMVLRRDAKITEIEIKEVYDNMSLADIISSKSLKDVRKYDRVIPCPTPQQ
jgi:hypothetical protein